MTDDAGSAAQNDALTSRLLQITELVVAEEHDAARQAMHEFWPEIADTVGFGHPDVPPSLYAGLALGYRHLSHMSDSRQFAIRALMDSPEDLLAHALTPVENRIALARQLIHHRQHNTARGILETILHVGQDEGAGFFLELLDFFKKAKAQVLSEPAQPVRDTARPTLLSLGIWGQEYVDKCLQYCLPSLLADGNVPALARDGNVIFDISTSETDRLVFESHPVVNELKRYADFRYTIIPDTLLRPERTASNADADRWCMAGMQYTAAIAARRFGADFSIIGADNIYSCDYLSEAKALISGGAGAVVNGALRAQEQPMAAYLEKQGGRNGNALEIDSPSLHAYFVENMNRQFFTLFIRSEAAIVNQDPVSIFLKTANGFAMHTFQLNAVMISAALLPDDFIYDYHTADARFLAEITAGMNPEDVITLVDTPERLFSLDLDAGTDGLARNFGDFPVTIDDCANVGLKWCNRTTDIPYFKWAFRQRYQVDCGSEVSALPDSDLDELVTIDDVLHRIDGKSAKAIEGMMFRSRNIPGLTPD